MNWQKRIERQRRQVELHAAVLEIIESLPVDLPGWTSFGEKIHWQTHSWSDWRKVRRQFRGWKMFGSPCRLESGRTHFVYKKNGVMSVTLYLSVVPRQCCAAQQ